jgi:galactarate dehydratase
VTEVRDGIDQLTARAASPEIAEAMIRKMAWYDAYLGRGGVDRSANTTPGNKRGGLSNIVEKAMGSILEPVPCQKAGVVSPGNRVGRIGLNYAATPPRRYAATPPRRHAGKRLHLRNPAGGRGINLQVFTTGRGTPYGLAEVPVIKVATRDDLARRWHDLMDLNAGLIATGEATIEDVGWELFRLLLDVASGRKTWAEH